MSFTARWASTVPKIFAFLTRTIPSISFFSPLFLTTLFPDALKNYFSEAGRVLRGGGRSFITYFLLNPESVALMSEGKSSLNFAYQLKDCWTAYPATQRARWPLTKLKSAALPCWRDPH